MVWRGHGEYTTEKNSRYLLECEGFQFHYWGIGLIAWKLYHKSYRNYIISGDMILCGIYHTCMFEKLVYKFLLLSPPMYCELNDILMSQMFIETKQCNTTTLQNHYDI